MIKVIQQCSIQTESYTIHLITLLIQKLLNSRTKHIFNGVVLCGSNFTTADVKVCTLHCLYVLSFPAKQCEGIWGIEN